MINIVCIDPGHGGNDPGACYKDLIEKEINLVIALKLKSELERHGIKVIMTRTQDEYKSLYQRCAAANSGQAILFISIHCNSERGDRGEVIHSIYRGKGLELSKKISEELKAIGQTTVKIYEKVGEGNKDYYSVIRNTAMDAVIVECAFLDNEVDNKIIDTKAEQELFGIAICKGILKQLGEIYINATSNENIAPVKYGIVIADVLNVRAGRGTTWEVIGQLKEGSKVKLCYLLNNWWSIDYGSNVGYVSADYIKVN